MKSHIADGRHWMKTAEQSMAQLDRVQPSVYNFSFADPNQLRNGHCLSQRSGSEVSLLSNHSTEATDSSSRLSRSKKAWGSNNSIPDMIRNQNERQKKRRPESAKTVRPGRPPSGRKGRPQSAKESLQMAVAEDVDINELNRMGVKGAPCDPQERPPGVSILGDGASGWISGPSQDKDFEDSFRRFMTDCPVSSPDSFSCMTPVDSTILHHDVPVNAVQAQETDLIPEAPCPSPEPIHFSLPQVDMEDDDAQVFLSVEDLLESNEPADFSSISHGKKNSQSVHFNEDHNQTVNISPRNASETIRPRSGKINLKNVKARVDSNFSRFKEGEKVDGIKASISNAAKELLDDKPQKLSISTVSVEYFDDIEKEKEEVRKKKKKSQEIESMMSRLGLCEDEDEESGKNEEKKDFRMTSQTYFDRLDALREKAARVKTVKTLRFGGVERREVIEDKAVTSIPQTVVKTRVVYVAPKPKVSKPEVIKSTEVKAEEKTDVEASEEVKIESSKAALPPSKTNIESTENKLAQDNQQSNPVTETKLEVKSTPMNPHICAMQTSKRRVQSATIHRDLKFVLRKKRPASSKTVALKEKECEASSCQKEKPVMQGPTRQFHIPGTKREPEKPPQKVIEIWTQREDFEAETEGTRDCREMHDRLIEAGVPVTLDTLKRGLLPPTEYGFHGETVKTRVTPDVPMNYSSSLISKPQYWLGTEYKKLQAARKKVRIATQQLLQQELEEKQALEPKESKTKKRRGKKKGKRAGSASKR